MLPTKSDIAARAPVPDWHGLLKSAPCATAAALAWCCAVILLTASAWLQTGFASPVWGPDDAMRLVQIRDWLNGQGWFDLSQARLDPAHPVIMHWSRVIDLPLAALIVLFEPILGAGPSERIALILWPFALLFALLFLSARLCRRFGGEVTMWIGVMLPSVTAGILSEFLPGRIDHHGLQMVLVVAMLTLVLQAQRDVRSAALAGVVAPLLLAIGLEPLPFVLAAAATLALHWIAGGEGAARALRAFGISATVATLALYLLTAPPARSAVNACDAFSGFHLTLATAGSAGMIVLALTSARLRPGWRRAAAAVAAGIPAVALAAYLAPQCLAAPYAELDARLHILWLSQIIEAQGAATLLADAPEKLLTYYAMAAAGLVVCLWHVAKCRGETHAAWLTLFLFLAMALVLALFQVRGAKFAFLLAVPPSAWLLARFYQAYRSAAAGARNAALARLVIAALLFAPPMHSSAAAALAKIARGYPGKKEQTRNSDAPTDRKCWASAALGPLDTLPAGLVLAPLNLGSHILLETHHAVLAANYHRGGRGILASFDIYNRPAAEARNQALAENVRYVVHCPGMTVRGADGQTAQDALAAKLQSGKTPSWLLPMPLPAGNPLSVYRVLR